MRKIFTIIILLCGIVGNSWAVCELSKSTDRTPSNEDLYPHNPDESRMALICQKGKCEDGEIVYMKLIHYWKNSFAVGGNFYKCKLGADDRWEVLTSSNVPRCPDDLGSRENTLDGNSLGAFFGIERSVGVYSDVCLKPYDEKCGVKCTIDDVVEGVYCNKKFWLCVKGVFEDMPTSLWKNCEYSDPQTRIDTYIVENEYLNHDNMSVWSANVLPEGKFLFNQIACDGCKSGFFYGGSSRECYDNLDQAWCKWRKNKESKNTEWKTDHCECLDKGKEWNTEKHDCVERNGSGKTGSGSGKTGSGSGKTGGGKIGSGTSSDTKCGVKCNAQNWSKVIFCEGDIYYCAHGNNEYSYVWANDSFDFCVYSDPGTIVGVEKKVAQKANTAIYGKKSLSLNNGDFVKYADYCNACGSVAKYVVLDDAVSDLVSFDLTEYGYWRWGLIKGCTNNEDEAWCEWQKVKAKMNVKWENNTCKCLDSGKKWDNVSHTCIPDNGAGDVSGQGDKKITTANCKININATVKCQNSGTFSGNVELELSAEKCQKYQANPGKNLSEIARLLCANRGGVDDFVSNAEVQEAKNRIDKFFEYAESNPSVWKNAEGKFNTARLASDATAGVILGTVGGIVSAHVIKKKQVEKGFDSLHCTIGGQTVADWGDEFRVGLGK